MKKILLKKIDTYFGITILLLITAIVLMLFVLQSIDNARDEIKAWSFTIPVKQEVELEKILYNEDGSIDTSEWKTYRNEEYGFEFKYPKNWLIISDFDSFIIKPVERIYDTNGYYGAISFQYHPQDAKSYFKSLESQVVDLDIDASQVLDDGLVVLTRANVITDIGIDNFYSAYDYAKDESIIFVHADVPQNRIVINSIIKTISF